MATAGGGCARRHSWAAGHNQHCRSVAWQCAQRGGKLPRLAILQAPRPAQHQALASLATMRSCQRPSRSTSWAWLRREPSGSTL